MFSQVQTSVVLKIAAVAHFQSPASPLKSGLRRFDKSTKGVWTSKLVHPITRSNGGVHKMAVSAWEELHWVQEAGNPSPTELRSPVKPVTAGAVTLAQLGTRAENDRKKAHCLRGSSKELIWAKKGFTQLFPKTRETLPSPSCLAGGLETTAFTAQAHSFPPSTAWVASLAEACMSRDMSCRKPDHEMQENLSRTSGTSVPAKQHFVLCCNSEASLTSGIQQSFETNGRWEASEPSPQTLWAPADPLRSRFSWLLPPNVSWYSREVFTQRILFPLMERDTQSTLHQPRLLSLKKEENPL